MHPNEQLIHTFYSAFQKGDFATMQQCYHNEATFSDPVFQNLSSKEVRAMWQMLISASKDLRVEFDQVRATDGRGTAHWDAYYTFSKTGNKVVNRIDASFEFKDGKILKHTDVFDFWKWSRQALGTTGLLLGWSPLVKNKVRGMATKSLRKFMKDQ
ncbi:MAG: nuclear transport factor 2 family protein [Bacteroidota bacterium]